MSDLVVQLEMEKSKRIAAMLSTFAKMGRPDLATEFKGIFALSDSIELLSRPVTRTRNPKAASLQEVNNTPAPDGFVLSDEVRRAIQKIDGERGDILFYGCNIRATSDSLSRVKCFAAEGSFPVHRGSASIYYRRFRFVARPSPLHLDLAGK